MTNWHQPIGVRKQTGKTIHNNKLEKKKKTRSKCKSFKNKRKKEKTLRGRQTSAESSGADLESKENMTTLHFYTIHKNITVFS